MILEFGKNTVALSHLGGQIIDWRYSGYHILFPQQMMVIGTTIRKLRGGMPIMFPNFGSDPFGILPKHGFLRNTYADPRPNLGRLSRGHTFVFTSRQENFPWKYNLGVNYLLNENGPEVRLTAYNYGNLRGYEAAGLMPINMGLHPYFYTPQNRAYVRIDGEEVHFVLGEITKSEKEAPLILPVDREIEVELWGLGVVKMSLSGAFSGEQARVVIWRDNPLYLCVEPVSTEPQLFGDGGRYIKTKGLEAASCKFSFLPKEY